MPLRATVCLAVPLHEFSMRALTGQAEWESHGRGRGKAGAGRGRRGRGRGEHGEEDRSVCCSEA